MNDAISERLLVEERCVRSVEARRVLVVEVPSGFRDGARLSEIIKQGELDWGPFPFDPFAGTEHLETVGLNVLRVTAEPADIPWQEVGYPKSCGISTNQESLSEKADDQVPYGVSSRHPTGCSFNERAGPAVMTQKTFENPLDRFGKKYAS